MAIAAGSIRIGTTRSLTGCILDSLVNQRLSLVVFQHEGGCDNHEHVDLCGGAEHIILNNLVGPREHLQKQQGMRLIKSDGQAVEMIGSHRTPTYVQCEKAEGKYDRSRELGDRAPTDKKD